MNPASSAVSVDQVFPPFVDVPRHLRAGPVGNPNALANILTVAVLLVGGLWYSAGSRLERWSAAAAAAVLALPLPLTGCRAALIGVTLGLVVVALVHRFGPTRIDAPGAGGRARWLAVLMLTASFAIGVWQGWPLMDRKLAHLDLTAENPRLFAWRVAGRGITSSCDRRSVGQALARSDMCSPTGNAN